MNPILQRWNSLDASSAAHEILPCCGSHAWAEGMAAARPFIVEQPLYEASNAIWAALPIAAWQEAFDSHPRIGEGHAQGKATAESLRWSKQEQQTTQASDAAAKLDMAEAHRRYEAKFGRIFIICASGRSMGEVLSILEARLNNDDQTELHEAAEQQCEITQRRLRRWMEGE